MTDYAQAATKQNKIVPGCANADAEETIAEMVKPKVVSVKKDAAQREVKDSAAQSQTYVSCEQFLRHANMNYICFVPFRLIHSSLPYFPPTTRAKITVAAKGSAYPRRTAKTTVANAKLAGQGSTATSVSRLFPHAGALTIAN